MRPCEVILGLGSNIGDRLNWLKQAVHLLSEGDSPALSMMEFSSLYESPALLPEGAPLEWDMPYINMAVAGITPLAPNDLLVRSKEIECRLGRSQKDRWAPREIDIDILVMADRVISNDRLTIPHAQLHKRDFALLPLAELRPNWRHPGPGELYGKTVQELIAPMQVEVTMVGKL